MGQFKESLHPITLFVNWARQHQEFELEFAEYTYVPRSLPDQRRLIRLPARELSMQWLEQKLSTLERGQELALHSRVYHGQKIAHFPMIDFVRFTSDARDLLASVSPAALLQSLHIFSSGRSYHGYSLKLLDIDEWVQFMGTLLLCNLPGEQPVVDDRWIGHRLIAGYGSLRWSCNSSTYLQYPQLVGPEVYALVHD